MSSVVLCERAEMNVTSEAPAAASLIVSGGRAHLTINDRVVVSDADHAAVTRWARSAAGARYASLSEAAFRAL